MFTSEGGFIGLPEGRLTVEGLGISNRDATPGIPLRLQGAATVRDVLEHYNTEVKTTVADRLLAQIGWVRSGCQELDAVGLVQAGLADPVRHFGKNEPHKLSKLVAGLLRLIANTSVNDVFSERVVFGPVYKALLPGWENHSCVVGLGLDDDGLQKLLNLVARMRNKVFGSDVSGWDWGFVLWMALAVWRLSCHLAAVALDSDWGCLALFSMLKSMAKVMALPAVSKAEPAQLVVLHWLGVWETGSYKTSWANSAARKVLSIVAGGLAVPSTAWSQAVYYQNKGLSSYQLGEVPVLDVTNGDDCVEEWAESPPYAAYKLLGHKVEVPDLPSGVLFEFCSVFFTTEVASCYPTSWPRQVYRLVSHKPDLGLLTQWQYECRHLEPGLYQRIRQKVLEEWGIQDPVPAGPSDP